MRSGIGLLGIVAVVLLIFGVDSEVSGLLRNGAPSLSGISVGANGLTAAVAVVVTLFLLRRTRLSLELLLVLGCIAYLLFARDFRVTAIAELGGPLRLCVIAAVLAALYLIVRRNPYRWGPYGYRRGSALLPILVVCGLAVISAFFLNPRSLEVVLPDGERVSASGSSVSPQSDWHIHFRNPLDDTPYH